MGDDPSFWRGEIPLCHAVGGVQGYVGAPGMFLLGIDTCGPEGSAALGRLTGMLSSELIAQKNLEGRSYSATLVAAVDTLLTENALQRYRLHRCGQRTG